jgi:transposase
MGKPHPIELRARVVAFVEEGNTNREAARHFRVSPRFVNTIVILKRASCGAIVFRQLKQVGYTRPHSLLL